jgi:hypothetical protein
MLLNTVLAGNKPDCDWPTQSIASGTLSLTRSGNLPMLFHTVPLVMLPTVTGFCMIDCEFCVWVHRSFIRRAQVFARCGRDLSVSGLQPRCRVCDVAPVKSVPFMLCDDAYAALLPTKPCRLR